MAFNLNLDPLKEPRGFIRVIQLFLAILAFATTVDYREKQEVRIHCNESTSDPSMDIISYEVSYPFNTRYIFQIKKYPTTCKTGEWKTVLFELDKESTAKFYVTTGVLSFMFSIFAIIVYIFMTETYENTGIFPFIDLIATAILTFFWFISWCTWVAKEGSIKSFVKEMPDNLCLELRTVSGSGLLITCDLGNSPSFSKLTSSLIFGFGNIILWAGSCWFVFKETHFHKKDDVRAGYTTDPHSNEQTPYQTGYQQTP
jgi:hypothetical protein